MNDKIKFRFVTRTLSEDFRVFYYDNGFIKQLDDNTEFAPMRSKGDIIPEEGPCVVLYEQDNKIFLIVSSMSRRTDDRAGRPIRFSFCRIYQHAKEDYSKALGAFTKIIGNWEAAEDMIDEKRIPPLLKTIPVMRSIKFDNFEKKIPGENVEFDETTFISWLESEPVSGEFKRCRQGKWTLAEFINNKLIPEEKFIFKWEKSTGFIDCMREAGENQNINSSPGISYTSIVGKTGKKIFQGFQDIKTFVQETANSTGTLNGNNMRNERDNLLRTINNMFKEYNSSMSDKQKQAVYDALKSIAFAFNPQ